MIRPRPLLLALLCCAAACDDADDSAQPYDPYAAHGHSAACLGDHDHYRPGQIRLTEAGLYALRFEADTDASDEAMSSLPPGAHTFTLMVLNPTTEAPQPEATITATLTGPEDAAPQPITVTALGDAEHRAQLDLDPPGTWLLRVEIGDADGLSLRWCVE